MFLEQNFVDLLVVQLILLILLYFTYFFIAHQCTNDSMYGSVLNWFKSYLTSRSFRVKCDKDFSSEHIFSCGVPQGHVLGPVLFVMYTTPLSTLISLLSLNHHLYADDTQLFFIPSSQL